MGHNSFPPYVLSLTNWRKLFISLHTNSIPYQMWPCCFSWIKGNNYWYFYIMLSVPRSLFRTNNTGSLLWARVTKLCSHLMSTNFWCLVYLSNILELTPRVVCVWDMLVCVREECDIQDCVTTASSILCLAARLS